MNNCLPELGGDKFEINFAILPCYLKHHKWPNFLHIFVIETKFHLTSRPFCCTPFIIWREYRRERITSFLYWKIFLKIFLKHLYLSISWSHPFFLTNLLMDSRYPIVPKFWEFTRFYVHFSIPQLFPILLFWRNTVIGIWGMVR